MLLFAHLYLSICTWTQDGTLLSLWRLYLIKKVEIIDRNSLQGKCVKIIVALLTFVRLQPSIIYVIEPTASLLLSIHFLKAVEHKRSLAPLKCSRIAQKARIRETGRSLGYLLGSILRGNSARDADSPEMTPQHPDGKWDKRKIKMLEIKKHRMFEDVLPSIHSRQKTTPGQDSQRSSVQRGDGR